MNVTKIECPKCNAHFTMPTDRIPQKGAKARCSRCKTVFRVPFGGGRGILKSGTGNVASNPARALQNRDKETLQAPGRSLDPELNAELAFDGPGDPFAKTMAARSKKAPFGFGTQNKLQALSAKEPSTDEAKPVSHKDLFSVEDPFRKTNLGANPALGGSSLSDALDAYLSEHPPPNESPERVVDAFASQEDAGDFFGDPTAKPAPVMNMNAGSLEAADSFFGPGLSAAPAADPIPHSSFEPNPTPAAPESDFLLNSLDSIDMGTTSHDEDHGFGDALITSASPQAPSMHTDDTDGDTSLLGDMNRAHQFAMDFDESDDSQFAGAYFDPVENKANATPVSTTSALDFDGPLELATEPPGSSGLRTSAPSSSPAPAARAPLNTTHTTGPVKVIPAAPAVSELTVANTTSPAQTIANVALIVVLVMIFFFGFVAWSHDGLLDFKHLGDQVKASFGQGSYVGRASLHAATSETPSAQPAPTKVPFPITNLQRLPFQNSKNEPLLILEGVITNATDQDVQGLRVTASLLENAKPIAETTVPVARTISEEELFDLLTPEDVQNVYTTLGNEAKGMVLKPGQSAKFSAVFLDVSQQKAQQLQHRLDVKSGVDSDVEKPEAGAEPKKEEKSPKKSAPKAPKVKKKG